MTEPAVSAQERKAALWAVGVFGAVTAVASALYWLGNAVPFVADNLHGLLAILFLYAPSIESRVRGAPFDYVENGGLGRVAWRPSLSTLGLVLFLTWPPFIAGFFVFYEYACQPDVTGFWDFWWQQFAPICPRWLGLDVLFESSGGGLRWPPAWLWSLLSQLLVVAIPEEFFFRGYILPRLEAAMPRGKPFLGGYWGGPLVLSAALFALGHVLVDFNPGRLAVFFPGLIFGWIRQRTGTIWTGAVYHALCNVLSDVLYRTFFA
jgi:membrane protease YdiL (CAAX protease family)